MSDDLDELYGMEPEEGREEAAPEFETMDLAEFCAKVQTSVEAAKNFMADDLSPDRAKAMAYYEGSVPDLASIQNRSQMVSNDLRAVVAKVQPAVMRVFASSATVVDFVADETTVEDDIEAVQKDINEDFGANGGYASLESALFDALVNDEGVIRYDVDDNGRVHFDAVPPECLLMQPDARSSADSQLIGFFTRMTRSDLIARGYDAEAVQEAEEGSTVQSVEDQERGLLNNAQNIDLGEQGEFVDVYEVYARIDFNGDGISELRRIVFINRCDEESILRNDEVPRVRLFIIRAEARAHSWRGRALARDVMDIQRAKTALLRNAMDNLAAVNDPTTLVDLSLVKNPDDLLSRERGAIILVDSIPQNGVIQTITIPNTAAQCFEAMKYYDAALIDRTGVSGAASGMLPEVMQGQTATAANMIASGGTARTELICRSIAEGGLRPMFEAAFLDVCEARGLQITLKEASVNVGLGSGTKERDQAALDNVMAVQEKLLAAYGGPDSNPLVGWKQIGNTLNKLVEVSGLRTKEAFFKEPTEEEVAVLRKNAANQKSPDQMKIEAQMMLEDKKMQVQRDKEMAQAQADVTVKQAEMERDAQKVQLEAQARQYEAEMKAQIEREKIASNEQIEREKMANQRIIAAMGKGGEDAPGIDLETGEAMPSRLETLSEMIASLAVSMRDMQSAIHAPRITEIIRDEHGRAAGAVQRLGNNNQMVN